MVGITAANYRRTPLLRISRVSNHLPYLSVESKAMVSQINGQFFDFPSRPPRQVWARYLEGDSIPTKIGSGQVEIEMAVPIYPKFRDGSGRPFQLFEFSRKVVKICSTLGSKVEVNRDIPTLPNFCA